MTYGLNVLYGQNGSGKTSLLEAIYYLSTGRSFKTATATRLIQKDQAMFSVVAQLERANSRQIPIGVERNLAGLSKMRMAEQDVASHVELTALLPLRIINAQSHQLFEAGPIFRRKFIDWGLYYAEEAFVSCWRHYERALKQRNILLREAKPRREIAVWTAELAKYGLVLHQFRSAYVAKLNFAAAQIAKLLLATQDLEFCYKSGWNTEKSLAEALDEAIFSDLAAGYTQYGPHRADFDININSQSARHFLSRGQQKLLICAMILAQGMLLFEQTNKGLIYLIDDLPAELDVQSRHLLMSLLAKQQTQIFITAIEKEIVCDALQAESMPIMKLFHVEHGKVVEKIMER